jgi:hypothetical protein
MFVVSILSFSPPPPLPMMLLCRHYFYCTILSLLDICVCVEEVSNIYTVLRLILPSYLPFYFIFAYAVLSPLIVVYLAQALHSPM